MSGGGWARVEIVQTGKAWSVVGVTTDGRRWEAANAPNRVTARAQGIETAAFMGVPLIDATTSAARLPSESDVRSFRWGN